MTFSVGESASRPKCAQAHLLLNSLCHGSMKSFHDFEMLDARIVSALRKIISSPLSEEESVLKSSELKNTTDS